jgi:dipeptidyl aminopeptidase/acylaminoacyl peptidase
MLYFGYMKFGFLFSIFSCPLAFLYAQLPDCDIWVFDIEDSAGNIVFHDPVNITSRKGYDNQPVFSPDGKYILYSSQHDNEGQTDIFKYNLNTKKVSRFTTTSTSEYSPTFTPDEKNISVVMVEKDSVQRLWKFPLNSGNPVCIMNTVKGIGYHCWINKDSVALFILTKPAFTLQIANVHTQKTTVLADSIGRCMKMRDGNLWYTTKAGPFWNVFEYDVKSQTSILKGIIESEDFLLIGANEIWSLSENSIVSGYMNSKAGAIEIVNLSKFGIINPARITMSPDGKKFAVVSVK